MKRKAVIVLAGMMLLSPGAAHGWHSRGHVVAVRAAAAAVRAGADGSQPGGFPDFLLAGVETIAHCSADPDAFTRPVAPAELHDQQSPEHYFDLELLAGQPLPATRDAFLELCFAKGLKPAKVGLLPYAVVEHAQRLAVALAEHRRWPDNPHIRLKCLVYAGLLAHYAADLHQPLHTTIHYDGRVGPDAKSPRTGIHYKVDALLGKLRADPAAAGRELGVEPAGALMAGVLKALEASHAKVDGVYDLEAELPAGDEPLVQQSRAAEFARERLVAAAGFTAWLWLTAWADSQNVQLPAWHNRPAWEAPSTAPTASPAGDRAGPATTQPAQRGQAAGRAGKLRP